MSLHFSIDKRCKAFFFYENGAAKNKVINLILLFTSSNTHSSKIKIPNACEKCLPSDRIYLKRSYMLKSRNVDKNDKEPKLKRQSHLTL